MHKEDIYKEKNNKYYSHIRHELIQMVEGSGNKILDIGCGEGQTGWVLKESGKAREVVGIELNEDAAKRAEGRLDKVIIGDVEKIIFSFQPEYFDYIILGDVVEHLIDPWRMIKQLSQFLTREGFLIVSIPNIGYWRVLKDLILFDKWEYQEEGILDKAHLRFFTKRSMIGMMNKAGFELESIVARRSMGIKAKLFNLFTLGIFRKFFESVYVIKGRKKRAC